MKLLDDAERSPTQLLATPNRLLESQPALRRLKEGLIDAQLKSADLVGRLSEQHPLAEAARNSEAEIRRNLHNEIASARTGVEVNLRLTSVRVEALEQRLAAEQVRLQRLATVRAKYANLSGAVKQRTLMLETAQRDLTAARSAKVAAQTASILTPIDSPDAGVKPIGPSRAILEVAGMLGGLIFGLGILFLTLPAEPVGPSVISASVLNAQAIESAVRRRQQIGGPTGPAPPTFDNRLGPEGTQEEQEAYKELRQQASRLIAMTETGTDPLDRRAQPQAIGGDARSIVRALARYDQLFSLAVFDIDDFREVNDLQGRVRGDQILQVVARVLDTETRETDLVARYSDEEFIVVMPHTDLEGAR